MAGIVAIRHDPVRHGRQTDKQADGLRQLVCLSRRQAEGDSPAATIGDHAGFRSIGLEARSPGDTVLPVKRVTGWLLQDGTAFVCG